MGTVLLLGDFGAGDPWTAEVLAACRTALASHRVLVSSTSPMSPAPFGPAPVDPARLGDLLRGLREADALIVAGGVLFGSASDRGAGLNLSLLSLVTASAVVAKWLGKRVIAIGVSAEPLQRAGARRRARWLVRKTDLLVLAEPTSAETLTAAGVPTPFRIGADPAWVTLQRVDSPDEGSGQVTVVVTEGALPRVGPWLVAGLAPLVAAGVPVRLQPWRSDDVALVIDTARRLGGDVAMLPPVGSLTDLQAVMREASIVVAMAYGALLAAVSSGIPVLSIAAERRTVSLARRLGSPTLPVGARAAELAPAVLAAGRQAVPAPHLLEGEADKARAAFHLVDLLLDDGRTNVSTLDNLPLGPTPWLP